MIGRRHVVWRMGIVGLLIVVGGTTWRIGAAGAEVGDGQAPRQAAATIVADDQLLDLSQLALQDDAAVSEPAIQRLRQQGPDAVEFLMSRPDLRKSPRWSAVLDAVAQQKDAEYSGLYWHTDLEQALAVAKREKKPILSLRLLGNLTDELSCANSRFFRTALYPNSGVRGLLASQFVLHWQSVRAVPIITIDFGDGRQIRRTITGNSLHLVLDGQGRTIDVLPGLYAPAAFAQELQQLAAAAPGLGALGESAFLARRTAYHRDRLQLRRQTWDDLCRTAKLTAPLAIGVNHDPAVWSSIAKQTADHPVLDTTARRAVIERGPPAAEVAGRLALSKSITETPAMVLIRNVTRFINEDSVRNEYDLHVQIHNWFAAKQPVPEREVLVRRIYSDLFLSPVDDPWYGLSRPDVFSAIKNDGRIDAVTQNAGH
ncbi:MAG TPA: hypothetical protein VGM05_27685 [Planctomycetaceae bacterium]